MRTLNAFAKYRAQLCMCGAAPVKASSTGLPLFLALERLGSTDRHEDRHLGREGR